MFDQNIAPMESFNHRLDVGFGFFDAQEADISTQNYDRYKQGSE